MINNKKILIVGGTGFIGYHLAKKLIINNSVTSISTKKPPKLRFIKKVKYLKFDISHMKNFSIINNIKFDYAINLSGYVDHTKKLKIFKSHYNGCKNLINYFKKKNLKYFIQVGSCTEYGHLKSPHKEKSKLKVASLKSFYSKAKLRASNIILNEINNKNFSGLILRPYLIYGPHQDYNRLISTVFKNCILDKSFPCSNGKQTRNFLYIDDFIEAIILSLKLKPKCKIINIGSKKSYKVKFILNKIKSITKKGKPLFGKIKLRPDEPKKIFPDLSNSKKYLGWKEKFSLNDGLRKTYSYYKKHVK